jgi:hypothetical protein
VTIFEPGYRRLAGAHPGREFGLGEACAQASPEQLGGNLELRRERVMLGLDLGLASRRALSFSNRIVILFPLRAAAASSIPARGAFCVFTNPRTTTTRRPIAVT